jgi:hypothetical protein
LFTTPVAITIEKSQAQHFNGTSSDSFSVVVSGVVLLINNLWESEELTRPPEKRANCKDNS